VLDVSSRSTTPSCCRSRRSHPQRALVQPVDSVNDRLRYRARPPAVIRRAVANTSVLPLLLNYSSAVPCPLPPKYAPFYKGKWPDQAFHLYPNFSHRLHLWNRVGGIFIASKWPIVASQKWFYTLFVRTVWGQSVQYGAREDVDGRTKRYHVFGPLCKLGGAEARGAGEQARENGGYPAEHPLTEPVLRRRLTPVGR